MLLAICAFSLSLLGTFLVRSGVLTSVHAFATDPKRGVFILAFLVFVIGSSLALFAWRAPKVGLGGKFETVSRESFLLLNNLLLAVAAGSVLLGTLYPLFLDALALPKASVGPPYFNLVFGAVMAPLVFLMGIGPLARWKKAELPDLATRLEVGVRRRAGDRADRSGDRRSLDAADQRWVVSRVLGDGVDRTQHQGTNSPRARRIVRAPARAGSRLLGNAARAFRHRGFHRRRDGRQRLSGRARHADERRRHGAGRPLRHQVRRNAKDSPARITPARVV